MDPETAYQSLLVRSRSRAMLASCLELLSWDELTYMPRGGVGHRGHQTAHLVGLLHEATADPQFGELLADVEHSPLVTDPRSPAAVNVRQWQRQFDRASQIPRSLVEELAEVTTTAQQRWASARQDSDFREFLPWLSRVVQLKREEAQCLRAFPSLYDALLDDYEPDGTTAALTDLFGRLRPALLQLAQAIAGSRHASNPAVLRREYPIERQRIFGEAVAAEIGFDFECGRLDATTHPFFSIIGPGDCRITTRYNQYDFAESFFSILHELGHGLYEQGLDPQHHGTPYGESSSLGVHESQSRIWENGIGRSRAFWRHFFPLARDLFHEALHDVRLDEFHRACNHVQPGWNRVQADEVTYDLHIMVRFELERDMILGVLKPADLPQAWNELYREYVGVSPANDREGCLQDGHWAAGQFGYFPTYSLGNIYAAQLMSRARREIPELDSMLHAGQFGGFRSWLQDKIFCHGQSYSAAELVRRASGHPPDCQFLLDNLWQKYSELYGL